MEFDDVVRKRHMTRRFSPDPIPAAHLNDVLALGTRAPSAGFTQGVDLVVLTSDPARERFWQVASDPAWRARAESAAGLVAAPAIVLPVADPQAYTDRYQAEDKATSLLFARDIEGWPVPYWLVDAAYCSMLILLGATSKDLGALFFQLHSEDSAVCEAFGIPGDRRLIGAIALGYAERDEVSGSPSRRARRPLTDVIHQEHW